VRSEPAPSRAALPPEPVTGRRRHDTTYTEVSPLPKRKGLGFSLHVAKGLMPLLDRTLTGLREMPSNALWLLSRAVSPVDAVDEVAGSAVASVRDQGRKVEAAVLDAAPVRGDSVDVRIRRARDAAERAREAEDRAREAAQDAKARAERVQEISEHGRRRLEEAERQSDRDVKQRVAEAEKAAQEFVRRERQAAEAAAEEHRSEVVEEVENEIADAHREADQARQDAEELVADASDQLAEAGRLADEAAGAARATAEEAQRQAQELTHQAERQASAAEAKVRTTEELRDELVTTAKETARSLNQETTNGLGSYSKAELVDLAAGIGIRGRSTMTKKELVAALRTASRRQ
jgi:colicin import membrane protein